MLARPLPRHVGRALPLFVASTERQKQQLKRRRNQQVVLPNASLSALEQMAVRAPTLRQYQRSIEVFLEWCRRRHMDWTTDAELDDRLTLLFDEMYFHGQPAESGSTLIAAIKHGMPAFRRQGAALLPRAARVLAAWRRMAPPRQRLPRPLV